MEKLKIGLTFSGGGYRAATFHLGVLTYLDSIKIGNSTLVNHVVALSTVSGGTITGLRYMLGLSRGESVQNVFKELYEFLLNTDLVTSALNNLANYKEGQSASLIRTMADIYNNELFEGAVLGDLMDKLEESHLSRFSANATDFTQGLPFRFQITEEIKSASETAFEYGFIGNEMNQLPRDVARHIRLSEILACSSCFPSGFEPMVFPRDFELGESVEVKNCLSKLTSIGIMDGGIVDNQGIEPILLAEQQIKREMPDKKDKCLDLIIISDVSSPYMEAYEPSNISLPKKIRSLSLNKISAILGWAEASATVLLVASLFSPIRYTTDVFFVIWFFVTVIWLLYSRIKKTIVKLAKESIIKQSVSSVLNLQVGDIATLVANRISSVVMLTTSVFMKHIRRLEYRRIYDDHNWDNRSITNTVYELRKDERWKSKIEQGKLAEDLAPSNLMQENSGKAASMGTTLWFTQEDKDRHVPDALIATGQYTICWNLLEYIEKIKKDRHNLNDSHEILLACEPQLRADWEKFQKDPLFKLAAWK
ncbi:patatin-like phospholipase family protein [Phocaeicola sp.]